MGILNVETLDAKLTYQGVNEPPHDFNGGWCFQADDGSRAVWLSDDVVLSFAHVIDDQQPDSDTIASLTFNIDTSGVKQATKDLSELEKAARNLANAYDRLHKAQRGPVEYHGCDDLAEVLFSSLIDNSKTGRVVIDRGGK